MVLPLQGTSLEVVRVAAIADLHYGRYPQGTFPPLLSHLASLADVLVLCGDLTDHGQMPEARAFAKELQQNVKIPTVAVFGNHDYESGHADEIKELLRETGTHVLDGDAVVVHGVGFAGVKGFAGGFGPRALGSWGEPMIKQFVQEAVNEALKLEAALARLRTQDRIALLHYSPVQSTVQGEPEDIYPFLGSSRLEEPLIRYKVTAALHGHAHHGQPEGKTAIGAPVYNVSLPLLQRISPDKTYRLLELHPPHESSEPV